MNEMHDPPHPGETLREDVLPALGLNITQAAKELGVTRAALSRVLNGRAAISQVMAGRLEAWLGVARGGRAELWLEMQAAYDMHKRRGSSKATLAAAEPVGVPEGPAHVATSPNDAISAIWSALSEISRKVATIDDSATLLKVLMYVGSLMQTVCKRIDVLTVSAAANAMTQTIDIRRYSAFTSRPAAPLPTEGAATVSAEKRMSIH